ncbi:MAG: winged helix-turn-helix domain-containing protein [Acidobacteria bacterium]|nr:winged helix-turn-helix domain-containing protein [Acidobacteriota bacterium]
MNDLPDNQISFAEFEVDLSRRTLSRDRDVVTLPAKAFDLLVYLLENNGRVLSKDEILNSVWEGRIVEEANLAVQISNVRKALGENKAAPRW